MGALAASAALRTSVELPITPSRRAQTTHRVVSESILHDRAMSDEPFYSPNYKSPAPSHERRKGELLLEFVRPSDQSPMSCELRFHDESYGWEALFLERGELFASHGGFGMKAQAVQNATALLSRGSQFRVLPGAPNHAAAELEPRREEVTLARRINLL
jgi:hypothetical protein